MEVLWGWGIALRGELERLNPPLMSVLSGAVLDVEPAPAEKLYHDYT